MKRPVAIVLTAIVLVGGLAQASSADPLEKRVEALLVRVSGLETYVAVVTAPRPRCAGSRTETLARWAHRRLRRLERSLGLDSPSRSPACEEIEPGILERLERRYIAVEITAR